MSSAHQQEVVLPQQLREVIEARLASDGLNLPFLPGAASRVMSACNDERCDGRSLSDLISRDQSLASHVLKVANSAAYAPKEPIVSLQHAVSRLGMSTVCEIALAVALKGRIFRVPGQQVKIRQMWMHSAASAVYAREVARLLRTNVEGAFLCGLLHDAGRPLVMEFVLDIAKQLSDRPVPEAVLDAAMDEFHERVGAMMVQRWKLPEWMAAAIGHHHHYQLAGEHKREAMIACLADVVTHWALAQDEQGAEFPEDHPVLAELGFYAEDVEKLLGLRGQVLELTEVFL